MPSAHGGMTSIPGRCERSVNGGDFICTMPVGHEGVHRNERGGTTYAYWPDSEAEDDMCAHGETYALSADGRLHRCEVCRTVLRQIEVTDRSEPHIWLTDLTTKPRTDRMVRYEVVA